MLKTSQVKFTIVKQANLTFLAKITGRKIYQIFKEPGNMGKVLPEYLSAWTTEKVKREGVSVIPNAEVEDATIKKDAKGVEKILLHLNNGTKVTVDQVVVSVGVEPNTDLAESSGLEIDPELGGFLVNTEMEARSNLYVVSFFISSIHFLIF